MCSRLLLLSLIYSAYTIYIDIWSSRKVLEFQQQTPQSTCIKNITQAYLLSTIHHKSHVVENLEDRDAWNVLFERSSTNVSVALSNGTYTYLHRDYANFEEKFAICRRFHTLHSFLVYIQSPSKIKINDDNSLLMSDKFVFFIIFPITIQWSGAVVHDMILWQDATVIYPFGIAKRLVGISDTIQKHPWRCRHSLDDIYVFETYGNRKISYKIKK